MADSDRLTTLLTWCTDVGIHIDSRLELIDSKQNGIYVRNCTNSYIESSTTLVTIPKHAVLSVRSCALSERIPFVSYGLGAQLGLSLALYCELLQESRSKWAGYLQSLPRTPVQIALLWGSDEVSLTDDQDRDVNVTEDLRHALNLAMATEIQREQRAEDGSLILDEVREYYYTVAQPLLAQASSTSKFFEPHALSLAGFLHAYSLVSSRAFLVDAYHGLAMVPIADAFNHTQENHVHLESEYDVCTSCGSLEQCPHDQDDTEEIIASSRSAHTTATPAIPVESHHRAHLLGSRSRLPVTNEAEVAREASLSKTAVGIYAPMTASTAATANSTGNHESDSVDTCDMVVNLVIPPGEEVFNTYGEHLTNAQLLARYGFALDGNENDVVTFDDDDLPPVNFDAQNGGVVDAARQVLALWPRYHRWKESSLVYHADTSAATEDAPSSSVRSFSNTSHPHNPSSSTPIRMCVNSDAKITHELWVCCALLSLAHQRVVFPTAEAEHNEHHDGEADVAALVQLADRQLYWEAQSEFGIEDGPDEDDDEGDELRERASSTNGTSTQHRLDKTLALLAQTVTWICTFSSRSRRLYSGAASLAVTPGSHIDVIHTCSSDMDVDTDRDNTAPSLQELGDMLDALSPSDRPYTRLALQQLISERSILESCRCAWEELAASVSSLGAPNMVRGSEEEDVDM